MLGKRVAVAFTHGLVGRARAGRDAARAWFAWLRAWFWTKPTQGAARRTAARAGAAASVARRLRRPLRQVPFILAGAAIASRNRWV